MNIISTIKPRGIADRTTAGTLDIINDVLWSDTITIWSDTTEKWGIQNLNSNAISPKIFFDNLPLKMAHIESNSPQIYALNMKPKMYKVSMESKITVIHTLYAGMPMGLLLALTYPTTTTY